MATTFLTSNPWFGTLVSAWGLTLVSGKCALELKTEEKSRKKDGILN